MVFRETRSRLLVSGGACNVAPEKANLADVRETTNRRRRGPTQQEGEWKGGGGGGGGRKRVNEPPASKMPVGALFLFLPAALLLVPVNSAFFSTVSRIGNCFCSAGRYNSARLHLIRTGERGQDGSGEGGGPNKSQRVTFSACASRHAISSAN